jgi:hypothetical protein
MKPDFEFTIGISTSSVPCVGEDCDRWISSGAKILLVNGRERDFCLECAKVYLKRFIKRLGRVPGSSYAVFGGASLRLTSPPDDIQDAHIDQLLSPVPKP